LARACALLPALLTLLRHLLQLPLQLFGLATQHLLLPSILKRLCRVALLLCEILLAAGQSVQLLQGVIDILRALFGWRSCLRRLILILLRVELEVEEAGEIAARIASASSTAAALLAKGYLNLAKGGLCAQKVLKRLLLDWKSIAPLKPTELLR
jgi:hypothetical protein